MAPTAIRDFARVVTISGVLLFSPGFFAESVASAPLVGEPDADGWIRSSGCLFIDDATGTRVQMRAGERRNAGRWEYKCEQCDSNLQLLARAADLGQRRLLEPPSIAPQVSVNLGGGDGGGCRTESGTQLREGEFFRENHVISKCVDGRIQVTGCYTSDGRELGIDAHFVANGLLYTCQGHADDANRVLYREEPCSGDGDQCAVVPSPSDVVGGGPPPLPPSSQRTLALERRENTQFAPPAPLSLMMS